MAVTVPGVHSLGATEDVVSSPVTDVSEKGRAVSRQVNQATVQQQVLATVSGVHSLDATRGNVSIPGTLKLTASQSEPVFPFADKEECGFVPTVPPAKPLVKSSSVSCVPACAPTNNSGTYWLYL